LKTIEGSHPTSPLDPHLGKYHDGEDSQEERSGMEDRLKSSATLREELEWLRAVGRGLRSGAPGTPPVGLGRRIMDKILEMHGAHHPLISLTPFMRRLAAVAALLTLVAAAAIFLQLKLQNPQDSKPTDRWIVVQRPDLLAPTGAPTIRIREPRPSELYQ